MHTVVHGVQEGGATLPGNPSDEIVLVSFPRPQGALLSNTPFAGKLEMMLRLSCLPYRGLVGNVTKPKHAPKRKVKLSPAKRLSAVPHG